MANNLKKIRNQHLKVEKIFNFCEGSMRWIMSFLDINTEERKIILQLITFLRVSAVNRGIPNTIQMSKQQRLTLYTSLSEDSRINPCLSGFVGQWSILNGIRKDSSHFKRCLLTVLSITRIFLLPPEIQIETITTPSNTANSDSLTKYIPGFWKALGLPKVLSHKGLYSKVGFRSFRLSTKKGPNGHAMETIINDWCSLKTETKQDINILGGPRLQNIIQNWNSLGLPIINDPVTRKIVAISDKEGKTREIAILDYFSQNALFGLHKYLMGILKSIPQDCTYDQTAFKSKLLNQVKEYNSIDLKSATDRFPIWLISQVLEYKCGKDYANAWSRTLVAIPFWVPQLGRLISYAVGNPMGAYSSWASFSLTHHFLVYCVCSRLKREWKDLNYVLLGDDIVINDNAVADEYLKLLQELDIPFNKSKTHRSLNFFEFAKRIFHNGVEVTPFPINALWKGRSRVESLVADLLDLSDRGWVLPKSMGESLNEFYSYQRLESRYRKLKTKDVNTLVLLTNYIRGKESKLVEVFKDLLVSEYPNFYHNLLKTEKTAEMRLAKILRALVHSRFMQSIVDYEHLVGNVPELETLKDLTSAYFSDLGWSPDQIETSSPWSHIVNNIRSQYKRLFSDETFQQDWNLTLRAVILPQDNTVFFSRNLDVKVIGSSIILKDLREQFSKLEKRHSPKLLSEH